MVMFYINYRTTDKTIKTLKFDRFQSMKQKETKSLGHFVVVKLWNIFIVNVMNLIKRVFILGPFQRSQTP